MGKSFFFFPFSPNFLNPSKKSVRGKSLTEVIHCSDNVMSVVVVVKMTDDEE